MRLPYSGRIKKPTDVFKQPFQDVCRLVGRGAFRVLKHVRGTPAAARSGEGIDKLLLVRRNRLGDAVCLLPAIQAIKEARPEIYLAVLANPYNASVFRLFPYIDRVYELPERYLGNRWLVRWHPVMRTIRAEGFDLAVSTTLTPSSHSARLCWYSGARRRAGVVSERGAIYDLMFDRPVRLEQIASIHQVEKVAELLRLAGLLLSRSLPRAELVLSPPVSKPPAARICICPEVNRPQSAWPVESYRHLIGGLRNRWPGLEIRLVLGSRQQHYAALAEAGVRVVCTSGFQDFVRELAGASLVVCSEGGTSHLAPALGVPTVVLSGVAIRQTWAPWSDLSVVLEATGEVGRIAPEEVLGAIAAFIEPALRQA